MPRALFGGTGSRSPYQAAWWVAAIGLALVGLVRVLRYPTGYIVAHQLITYEHGFVRRGLYGTLFAPLVAIQAEPRKVQVALGVASLVLLLIAIALIIERGRRAAGGAITDPRGLIPLAFFASPAFLLFIHCIGYADVVLLIGGIVAGILLRRRRYAFAGFAVAAAALCHELALVICLPALSVAVLILALRETPALSFRQLALRVAAFIAPPIAAGLAIRTFGYPDEARQLAIEISVLEPRAVLQCEAGTMFHFLGHDVSEAWADMQGIWEKRTDATFFITEHLIHLPFVLLVLVAVDAHVARLAQAHPRRRLVRGGLFLLGLIALHLPIALHLVAWDSNRIAGFVAYAALVLWLAVDGDDLPSSDSVAPSSRRLWVCAAIVAVTTTIAVPSLFDDLRPATRITMARSLRVRWDWAKPKARYESFEGPLLFPGASFEEGMPTDAWTNAPELLERGRHPTSKHVVIPDGRRYLSTYGRRTQVVTSREFTIEKGVIMAKIGGTCEAKNAVEVVVGAERRTFTCPKVGDRFWEDMRLGVVDVRDLVGQKARIRIVDRAIWGHINVDGFRYQVAYRR